jgi:hypothetical protein
MFISNKIAMSDRNGNNRIKKGYLKQPFIIDNN